MARRLLLAVLGLALVGAADGPVPVRVMKLQTRGPFLTLGVGMSDVVDPALRKRLASGFVSTIVLRAYLYREGDTRPIGVTARTYRLVYDLWEERYFVQVRDPQGERRLVFKIPEQALAELSQLVDFPLAPLSVVQPRVRYFVAVILEVNPISPELLAQVRRWLAHPGGSERAAGGEGILGSFVSVFVHENVSEAERILKFRSPAFAREELR